ncbi:MAG: ferredoxin [Nitrospira sp. HN-bin3]|uniref:four-helix bundle copper-binding protein n=1 Tax=Nitrospira cf. moscoviensis SBR1015 TaxID=96242 RepID=UPI000A09D076|nr:four-helix bundle copper-binding protein [Nitrospira cf. moscoviensis SBR1015]OQW40545.1 MAG: ferredoxin [Nitrospira sp. HN-bin3]
MNVDMQRCIRLCRDCHAQCIELLDHCVTLGGRHVAPAHIRLLMDCAQLCTVTADFMARASALHDRTCTLCAEACRRCAESCAQLAGSDQLLKQCAELCRHCAESCDRMAIHSAA